ncbi:MAG: sugar transferase [Alphaproteobacteria bacterium]|uniref:sugar transferase n=1 Tax=Alexandriicola marinus TaxID=2081710 RepID=UPI000FD982A0|nr:sugar transferase [Alexandriicola marinus]MBM1220417.1 sugar transferase [Ponticoccus sp. SC6-9]MBM1225103.1 sugar transferase [Ponticoccus sp. SC6-15]MBM1228617.1 sugar transferase [Ponticoccus sp. SC6-38]MBM1233746.1 sugar transferase [Ponticoccus sp. SC6-45]MBM1239118.1 sugar transferase [Ponticoccus sp. SC6-49]MBM1242900.1 sugar transferase [Ponticoccus sp. SC2-64]MBM1247270.1 sugar transferase [Ponticoccus sp. SC6-42]MBM1252071.1 sugar transferase [Ponticoccus sp. SC6-33]MBM1257127
MSYQYRSTYDAATLQRPISTPTELCQKGVYRRAFKRIFDVLVVLAVSFPVVTTVALLALVQFASDRRNPFYSQDRVGRNGTTFRMWKLRTMVCDADDLLEIHLAQNPKAMAEWQRHQKLTADPRVTTFGRFLRTTSLDELPQFWNVLIGDMSVVGPRPMMTAQRVLYPGTEYYAMRPGITGLWQISERNDTTFHERADYDQRYFQSISFLTDMKVIFRTVVVVMKATGR